MKNRYQLSVVFSCEKYLKEELISFETLKAAIRWAELSINTKGFIKASVLDLQSNSIEWNSEHAK